MTISILLSLSLPRIATAAVKPLALNSNSQEVPFFKSIESQFPSGYTTLENLKKQLVSSQSGQGHFYQWNKIYFSLNDLKPLFATHLSRYVIDNSTGKRYKVLATNIQSIEVEDNSSQVSKKLPITQVHADAYDSGYIITLKDSYLKTSADEKADIQTTIPQGTRLVAESYKDHFALVKYKNYTGYVSLSELMTKYDFASFIYADGNWYKVKNRDFSVITTSEFKKISLNDIKGMITPDSRGIIASTTQKLPMWSIIETTKEKFSLWNQSKLKGHGLIWWKAIPGDERPYFTTDELLKKEVSSVSFHPHNPLKGVLSADGVYMTDDGEHWRKLDQFESFNGPVHYFNDSLIFVGNFRSTDGGNSFENYIQLEKLTSAIEDEYGFTPKKLQVKNIETIFPYKLKIEIETGLRRIKMESPLFTQNWKAVKS